MTLSGNERRKCIAAQKPGQVNVERSRTYGKSAPKSPSTEETLHTEVLRPHVRKNETK